MHAVRPNSTTAPSVTVDWAPAEDRFTHSEIEVAQCSDWGPTEIYERGLRLLRFMEKRWDFQFSDDESRESLLFIESHNGSDDEEAD